MYLWTVNRWVCLQVILLFSFSNPSSPSAQELPDAETRPNQSFDVRLLREFNGWGSDDPQGNSKTPTLDGLMIGMTYAAVPVSIGVPAGLYIFGVTRKDRSIAISGASAGASTGLAGLLTLGIKEIVRRPRPYRSIDGLRLPTGGSDGFSFPSAHSSTAFALATSVSISFPKWYVIGPAAAYATMVALSRPYLGVHYPSDIAVGALVGAGSAVAIHQFEGELADFFSFLFPVEASGAVPHSMERQFHLPEPSRGFQIGTSFTF